MVLREMLKLMLLQLNEFISLAGPRMLPFATECVGGILPSLSYGVDGKLRDLASETNKRLKALVAASAETENLVILPPVRCDQRFDSVKKHDVWCGTLELINELPDCNR